MRLELQAARWQVINDGVMGGCSRSRVRAFQQGLVFRGQLSLDNNGGFVSARCKIDQALHEISGFRLCVRGDGRSYQFRLRADEHSGGIAWRATFPTDGNLQEIELPLTAFEPVVRGRKVRADGDLIPGDMHWVGLMLTDSVPGPFALELRQIETMDA